RAIARRTTESKQQVPHYYVTTEVLMDNLTEIRAALGRIEPPRDCSVTAFIVKAVAVALHQFPQVNASWLNGRLLYHRSVDVGVAVALDDGGLVVPVVRAPRERSIISLSGHLEEMSTRARAGKLDASELSGASFSVSNLGMYGVDEFHAIITPPESGI